MELTPPTAQSRVEQYLAAAYKSRTVIKPEAVEGETRPRYAWRLLRGSLKAATEVLRQADSRDVAIAHGLVHSRKLSHPKAITDVLYNKNTREYISLDGERIRIFEIDGRLKSCSEPGEKFGRLLYATHINLYIAWNFGCENLMLLDASFVKRSKVSASGPVLTAVYNENIGEIVVAGPGFVASWVFRYGGRCLLPRKITTEGLSSVSDRFSIIALEDSASQAQRAFLANGRSVAIFNLFSGSLLSYRHYLHDRCITALLFYNPLKYLVTAAKDGTVKLWDENWNLQLVFIGHMGGILGMSVSPFGSKIMTVGDDQTLRTWSLESCDEVENIEVSQGTHALGTVVNMDNVFTVAESHIDIWKFNHIHLLNTRIGEAVTKIRSTNHPDFPVRCVLDCVDSSVRIVSPTSGEVITTLLVAVNRGLVASAYAIAEDTLFAAFEDGAIIKADTCINPCTVMDEWKCTDSRKAATCLVIYEFVVKAASGADSYASAAKRTEVLKGLPGGNAGRYRSRTQSSRTLLLGGLRNGQVCVYNWDNGSIDFATQAHDENGVGSMILNIAKDQLITSGFDNLIKVWRVYPYAKDSLASVMSLHVAEPPVGLTVANHRLVAAFENSEAASYTVIMFNLKTKGRYDHVPNDDHLQPVTGLSSCPVMKLFASSSQDGTIRIWNNQNRLLRVISLQCVAKSIDFCSSKGDLLLAIGDHVHKIDYAKYMPRSYLLKMASTDFPEPPNEKLFPFDENSINLMKHDDVKRLKSARSAFRFTHFVDILTRKEAQEFIREKREREKVYSKLEAREKELIMIRDGQLETVVKSESSPEIKQEAFDNYIKAFFDRPQIEALPEEPTFFEQNEETHEEFVPEKEPLGFFPPPKRVRPASVGLRRQHQGRLLPPVDGFIPNSVLVKLLFPEKMEPVEETCADESEICLDDPERLERLRQANGKMVGSRSSSASFEDHVQILDYVDEPKDEDSDMELEAGKVSSGRLVQKSEEEVVKSKLNDLLRKASPESSFGPENGEQEGAVTYRSVEMESALTGHRSMSMAAGGSKKVENGSTKRILDDDNSRAKFRNLDSLSDSSIKTPTNFDLPSALDRLTADVTTEDETTDSGGKIEQKSRGLVDLPDYLTRFSGRDWFDKHFPRSELENLSRSCALEDFVSMLLHLLRTSEYSTRTEIAEALLELSRCHGVRNPNDVYTVIYGILRDDKTSPSFDCPTDVAFVRAALKLMHALGKYDVKFYEELMVIYLEGDDELKAMVMSSLERNGLRDAGREFPKELDSWDVWSIEGKHRNAGLRSACGDWLSKWMTLFKNHVHDSAERLQKGHGVHGQVQLDQVKGLMSKRSPEHVVKTTSGSGVISVTVAHGNELGSNAASKATYMDAINYFCEMAMHRQYLGKEGSRTDDGLLSSKRNTIISQHRPCCGKGPLVRIGDTHTSRCHPRRETAYQVDFVLPALNYINLPMKKIVVNPFPRAEDENDPLYSCHQPILLMLKTNQKYFIPARSFIVQHS